MTPRFESMTLLVVATLCFGPFSAHCSQSQPDLADFAALLGANAWDFVIPPNIVTKKLRIKIMHCEAHPNESTSSTIQDTVFPWNGESPIRVTSSSAVGRIRVQVGRLSAATKFDPMATFRVMDGTQEHDGMQILYARFREGSPVEIEEYIGVRWEPVD